MDYLQYIQKQEQMKKNFIKVLNLIISGLPSILSTVAIVLSKLLLLVLNLIINGLPSIHTKTFEKIFKLLGFKPYYKWITFNTGNLVAHCGENGLSFKPYYKWITFNTERH